MRKTDVGVFAALVFLTGIHGCFGFSLIALILIIITREIKREKSKKMGA